MTRDTLAVYNLGVEGAQTSVDITLTAMVAANDMDFLNDGLTMIHMFNSGTTDPCTATFVGAACSHCGKTEDLVVACGINDHRIVGPFLSDYWNQSDGKVHIDSAEEDLFHFAAFKIHPSLG